MSKIYHSYKKPAFSATSKERLEMSEEIFRLLAVTLNKIHATEYSERFWKILTAPYVGSIINNRVLLNEKAIVIKPKTYPANNMFKSKLDLNIYQKVRKLYIIFKSFGNYKKIKNQLKKGYNIAIGFHYSKAIKLKADTFMDVYYPMLSLKKENKKKREISIDYPENHSKIFILNVVRNIPKIYVEYFDYFVNKVPIYNPEEKTFHMSMIANVFLRYILAKYSEQGAKLNYYQHGGFYGEFKYHNAYNYESSISDKFMTWGWKMNESDVPSPAYRLEKFKDSFNINDKKIVDLLLIYSGINHVNEEFYKKVSSLFFSKINRAKFAKICARPRPKSTFNRKADLAFISKEDVKIDSGYTSLSKLISTSKLVILTYHPSTTIFECMYVDQPVVALLDNDDPSEIIMPYYDFLLEKKLLHQTVNSMILHLNTTDLEVWWEELIKHPTYLSFKNTFLRKL